jgi:hypothetical protein
MKNVVMLSLIVLVFLGGCGSKCKSIPYWDGKSTKDFEGKTMTSMVWLYPHQDNIERWEVYKRFDGADFKVLLSCMKNPGKKWPLREDVTDECLYLSFLDGTRYIVGFRCDTCNSYILLRNGASKILYKLLIEKEPCPAFDSKKDPMIGHPVDPNRIGPAEPN